jgi:PEP-CTERM motif
MEKQAECGMRANRYRPQGGTMVTTLRIFRSILLAFGLFSGMGLLTQAQAVTTGPILSTFDWVGSCSDCTTFGNPLNNIVTASLTLQDYTPGDEIHIGNFVSFSYSGSNLVNPYTVAVGLDTSAYAGIFGTDFAQVAGNIQTLPGGNRFELVWDDGLHFQTQANGLWSTCAPGPGPLGNTIYAGGNSCQAFIFSLHADTGSGGTFTTTPVPEPGVWAMLCMGLGVLAVVGRRRTH